jgi:hypothetical protein
LAYLSVHTLYQLDLAGRGDQNRTPGVFFDPRALLVIFEGPREETPYRGLWRIADGGINVVELTEEVEAPAPPAEEPNQKTACRGFCIPVQAAYNTGGAMGVISGGRSRMWFGKPGRSDCMHPPPAKVER